MLESLKLSQFRCFERLQLSLEPGVTVFIGNNAQGKTSILEAVCVLLRLQSPRSTSWSDLVRFDQPGFGIAGEWDGHGLQIVHQVRSRRKLYHHGQELRRTRDYLSVSGLVVWIGNDDLRLVAGTGSHRRRYLDFLASQLYPGYRSTLRAYERALRARNHLLKQPTGKGMAPLEAYTTVLADHGRRLMESRARLVEELAPALTASQDRISAHRETLTLSYAPNPAQDSLVEALAAAKPADLHRGQTTVGPHRDDLDIRIDGRPASKFASEGQQRTIALALKLAQIDRLRATQEKTPILLVDDIFGELDPERRRALLQALPAGGQKLLTTTSLDWIPACATLDAQTYRVAAGTVTPLLRSETRRTLPG